MTDAPATVDVQVTPPLGNSDHSCLSFKVQTRFPLPDEPINRVVHLKSRANWTGISEDVANIRWGDVFKSACPVTTLNETR